MIIYNLNSYSKMEIKKDLYLASDIDTQEGALIAEKNAWKGNLIISLPKRIFEALLWARSQKLNNYTGNEIINERDPLDNKGDQ